MTPTTYLKKTGYVLLGLVLALAVLEFWLRLGGFAINSLQEHRNRAALDRKGTYRILCLGESTTAMQYPSFLEEILNRKGTDLRFSVIDKGVTGATTATLLSSLEQQLDAYRPDMVITMMGINDASGDPLRTNALVLKVIGFFRASRVFQLMQSRWEWFIAQLKTSEFSAFLARYLNKRAPSEKALSLSDEMINEGNLYRNLKKFSEAEDCYKKALTLDPKNENAYIELGISFRKQNKFDKAEEAFQKALEINPKNGQAYFELGNYYRKLGQYGEPEAPNERTQTVDSEDIRESPDAKTRDSNEAKTEEATELFKKLVEIHPESDRAYAALGMAYGEMGHSELAEAYAQKAEELRLSCFRPGTADNYCTLKEILERRGIVFVCAQYPMRSIGPLKKIFERDPKGIVFVDNEEVFRNAVREEGYSEYFGDMFGGDFGHCTQKGDRLLAENIANTLFREVFNKE